MNAFAAGGTRGRGRRGHAGPPRPAQPEEIQGVIRPRTGTHQGRDTLYTSGRVVVGPSPCWPHVPARNLLRSRQRMRTSGAPATAGPRQRGVPRPGDRLALLAPLAAKILQMSISRQRNTTRRRRRGFTRNPWARPSALSKIAAGEAGAGENRGTQPPVQREPVAEFGRTRRP